MGPETNLGFLQAILFRLERLLFRNEQLVIAQPSGAMQGYLELILPTS